MGVFECGIALAPIDSQASVRCTEQTKSFLADVTSLPKSRGSVRVFPDLARLSDARFVLGDYDRPVLMPVTALQ